MAITALQVYGIPGRPGGPYVAPPPAPHIPKRFRVTATRAATYPLAATRTAAFQLVAERKAALALEV